MLDQTQSVDIGNMVFQEILDNANAAIEVQYHENMFDFFKKLKPKEQLQQILFNQLWRGQIDKAQAILNTGLVTIREAKSHNPHNAWTLPQLAVANVSLDNDWELYQLLRRNDYSCEELAGGIHHFPPSAALSPVDIKAHPDFEQVEALLQQRDPQSLIWRAAKKVAPMDAERVAGIPELKDAIDAVKPSKIKAR